ncbi:hypothetical protein AAC387_Pa08g1109 [Persea americana]
MEMFRLTHTHRDGQLVDRAAEDALRTREELKVSSLTPKADLEGIGLRCSPQRFILQKDATGRQEGLNRVEWGNQKQATRKGGILDSPLDKTYGRKKEVILGSILNNSSFPKQGLVNSFHRLLESRSLKQHSVWDMWLEALVYYI